MIRVVFSFTIVSLIFVSPLLAQVHDGHTVQEKEVSALPVIKQEMAGPLGISQSRDGSGTSWLPEASPMYAIHSQLGQWQLMFHGNIFLQYIKEYGDRGDDQFGSINWLMGMAQRDLGHGELMLRSMVSAESWTVGECGYPDLLATGEFCNGEPIHDRQHPHDLFMELAASYKHELTSQLAFEIYGGPVAEPALGPTAYPHRISAYLGPLAPITHHWFDSTHITFGSLTVGVFGRQWKLESSVFNGREPDEVRTDFDFAPMDSYSGRFTLLPSKAWSLQISAGQLNEAEPGHNTGEDRIDVTRYTASATYHRLQVNGSLWASTLALGRNDEGGESTNSAFLESSLNRSDKHIYSGRFEWVEKDGRDLALEDESVEDRIISLSKASIGYTYQFGSVAGWTPGIGAGVSVSFLPSDLERFYGERTPLGYVIYASLRPAQMSMSEALR